MNFFSPLYSWLILVVGSLAAIACTETSRHDMKQIRNEVKPVFELDKYLAEILLKDSRLYVPPPLSKGIHGQMQEFALSADGNRLALLIEGRPWNEIIVFNWRNAKAQIFTYPTREYKISSPEFSPDGNMLAVVLHMNVLHHDKNAGGQSEIVVFDMQGNIALQLNDANSVYKLPSFSYDGKKLLFGKGVLAGPAGSDPIKSSKSRLGWLPFEVELKSQQHNQLLSISGSRAWGELWQLYYDNNDADFFFYQAADPQKPRKSKANGLWMWDTDYENRRGPFTDSGIYRSKIGQTVTLPLKYYHPSHLSFDPRDFYDVTASGYKIITHYVRSEEYDFETFAYPIKPSILNVDIYHGAKKINLTDTQTGRLLLKKILIMVMIYKRAGYQ